MRGGARKEAGRCSARKKKEARRGRPDEKRGVERDLQFEFVGLPFLVGDRDVFMAEIFQMPTAEEMALFDEPLITDLSRPL